MKNTPLIWIISSVLCSTVGHFVLKVGALRLNLNEMTSNFYINRWLMLGGAFHLTALVLWIVGLRRVDLTVAYPFIALGLVLVSLLSWMFLREGLGPARVIGMLLIGSGVV